MESDAGALASAEGGHGRGRREGIEREVLERSRSGDKGFGGMLGCPFLGQWRKGEGSRFVPRLGQRVGGGARERVVHGTWLRP
jgi:hypothetical protein